MLQKYDGGETIWYKPVVKPPKPYHTVRNDYFKFYKIKYLLCFYKKSTK